ncbi:uncharacterized protein MELLADRAFT_110060 [Melampsora larici-populina 98AG31]|uniref:Uncharacterized protein n=1 Tax=Melampsora larici-populina (strain 98AG31 / pathotype 3-4-7) TaxID=747676 RepID=F4RYI7_MELLP|nr:uncharacterized protein MELLADRAFT_110060 [Melampsora larici-populina 98AG31]EGG02478.1 hypothetical protein MELLADRAFT_110060 [Melampsora larici-populina 98AG31]
MRTYFLPDGIDSAVHWLLLPVMKNVRTIVTDLYWIGDYWKKDSRRLAVLNKLKEEPNLKYIVLTRGENHENQAVNAELIQEFQSQGVQCHITHHLTALEVLELDYKLNGPMN